MLIPAFITAGIFYFQPAQILPVKVFTKIPFLRISVPFISGILFGYFFAAPRISIYLCLLTGLLGIFSFIKKSKPYGLLFLISADVFFFTYGLCLVGKSDLRADTNFYGNHVSADSIVKMVVVINDIPVQTQRTVKCQTRMLQIHTKNGWIRTSGNLLVYVKRSEKARSLRAGETVLMAAHLSDLPDPKNPFEFDYRNYLQNKQIYHIAFVDSDLISLPDQQNLNFVWQLGLDLKEKVLHRLRSGLLSSEAAAICSALLTGYDDDIERPILEAFSHSGTLHVLSVSGLHVGLIYMCLNLLLGFMDKENKFRGLRFFAITLFLWFFALITGFSAPVLRAVIMFNLLGLGKLYFRSHSENQINILFVSAFILLNYNPLYLFDIGFLLSYSAMLGLIYFQPRMALLWSPSNFVTKYTWESICASVAATISTLPLTLFYFKQFPVWFIACNLVVVPATFLILILSFLFLIKINWMAVVINQSISILISFISVFNSITYSVIDRIHFDSYDLVLLSLLLILFTSSFRRRSYWWLTLSMSLLIAWQLLSIFHSFYTKEQSLFTVYELKKSSSFSLKNKQQVNFLIEDPSQFNYHIKPHITSFNYGILNPSEFNYVKGGENSILILGGGNEMPGKYINEITTLILTRNFVLTEDHLKALPLLKTIVMDGSNNIRTAATAEKLCRKFGIGFYNTRWSGAYMTPL